MANIWQVRGTIGGVFGSLGFLCLFLALAINDLSGYSYYQDGLGNTTEQCKWNELCLNADTQPKVCVEYSECQYYFGFDFNCHDTKIAGQLYLALTSTALMLSFVATLTCFMSLFNRLTKLVFVMYLAAGICCIAAASHWIYEGNRGPVRCYNVNVEQRYLGASIVFLWIGMALYLIAAVATVNKAPIVPSGLSAQPLVTSNIGDEVPDDKL